MYFDNIKVLTNPSQSSKPCKPPAQPLQRTPTGEEQVMSVTFESWSELALAGSPNLCETQGNMASAPTHDP